MKDIFKKKKFRIILLIYLIFFPNFFVYALPSSKNESIDNKKNDGPLIIGGKVDKNKCFNYLGEAETEIGSFKKITNFLGCNSISKPLSFCKCLKTLGGDAPNIVRDIPKEIIETLTSKKIKDLDEIKKTKESFVSTFDGVEKKKISFQFDQIYCEALKNYEDQRNKNDLLAKEIIKDIDEIEKKLIGLESKIEQSYGKIEEKRKDLKKFKKQLKLKKISKDQYLEKEKEFITFKKEMEEKIRLIKKEKEEKKFSEKLIFSFHMLKITDPISLDLIKNKIEKELKDESVPITKKHALYELIYYLGKKGDDESVKYLGDLISKIDPDHPIYNSVVKALGFSRNPKGFERLYEKLKEDSKIRSYQKNFYFYKSLGLMMENNPKLIENKINDFKNLKPNDKKDLLLILANVKNDKVYDFLKTANKKDERGIVYESLKDILSDIKTKEERERVKNVLEDQIQIGLLRNTKVNLDNFLYEKIINSNLESMKSDYSKIQFSERLLNLERYDLVVKIIGKNQDKLLENESYINGLFKGLIRKVSSDSKNLKMDDLRKTSEALRELGKSENPKVKSMAKEALLKIGDPNEIKRVLNESKSDNKREKSLSELQNVRAKDRFTQQNVIKHYEKAVKELTKPKKNETVSEKKEREKKLKDFKNSNFGKLIEFQKESIKKSKETDVGKKLASMDYGRIRGSNDYQNFFGRPRSLTKPILGKTKLTPPSDELDFQEKKIGKMPSINPFSSLIKSKKINQAEKISEKDKALAEKYMKKVFNHEIQKAPKNLLLPEKSLKPISSFKSKNSLKRELRKLESDINYKENMLARSFGSSQGDEFWKNNNLRSRLNDSRKEAFRNLKEELETKKNFIELPKKNNKKSISRTKSPFVDDNPTSFTAPKEVIEKPTLKNLKVDGAEPITGNNFNQKDYNYSKVQSASELLDDLVNDKPLYFTSKMEKEDDFLKEEEFKILLISKENKNSKMIKEEVIAVEEEFLSLEETEREKRLIKLFERTDAVNLVLRTPKGILIRVERKVKLLKKPSVVKAHEERIIIEDKLSEKEKRVDDLYKKLKSFLKKSKTR